MLPIDPFVWTLRVNRLWCETPVPAESFFANRREQVFGDRVSSLGKPCANRSCDRVAVRAGIDFRDRLGYRQAVHSP